MSSNAASCRDLDWVLHCQRLREWNGSCNLHECWAVEWLGHWRKFGESATYARVALLLKVCQADLAIRMPMPSLEAS